MTLDNGIDVYMLAGVATRPGFFQECEAIMSEYSRQFGWGETQVRILYPYGDYTRSLLRQIHEIRRDLSTSRRRRRIGGEAAALPVRRDSSGRTILLLGHSGGGVAAYHAGRMLLEEGVVTDCRIAQIGSPKVRVDPALRDKVGYIYAVNERGRSKDNITRIGSWGGFRRAGTGMPLWDRRKYAPGYIAAIPLVGGHADYFRSRPPFVRSQVSNLELTLGAVWDWLRDLTQTSAGTGLAPQ